MSDSGGMESRTTARILLFLLMFSYCWKSKVMLYNLGVWCFVLFFPILQLVAMARISPP